jgi:lipopolysaccharide export system permease protein
MLKQYLVPLGYCVGAFCLLYVVLDLFDRFADFAEAKAGALDIVVYYGYYLFKVNGFVPFITVVFPIAMLLAGLYTLTMFARHNELVAMCASGVSLRRMLAPLMGVGLCASLFCAVVQETLGPKATRWIADYQRHVIRKQDVSSQIERNYLYHTGRKHRQWLIQELNLKDPTRPRGIKVTQERPDGSLAEEILAERAEYLDGAWWFYGCRRRAYNETSDPVGPLSAPSERPVEMPGLRETPDDFVNELREADFLSSAEMMRSLRNRPNVTGAWRARREVDIHARLAMPWSCMVLILLSLPAAAGGVRRPALRSVAFGLVALFGFYFLVNAGMILGKREWIWPWLAGWLPNLVFLGIGGWLTWRLR